MEVIRSTGCFSGNTDDDDDDVDTNWPMFRYGAPPTPAKFDFKSVVTASDSYVGDKLFSQDIRIERPYPGWVASSHCQGWESFSKVSVNDEQMSGVGYKKKGENMKILTWFPLYNFELN